MVTVGAEDISILLILLLAVKIDQQFNGWIDALRDLVIKRFMPRQIALQLIRSWSLGGYPICDMHDT